MFLYQLLLYTTTVNSIYRNQFPVKYSSVVRNNKMFTVKYSKDKKSSENKPISSYISRSYRIHGKRKCISNQKQGPDPSGARVSKVLFYFKYHEHLFVVFEILSWNIITYICQLKNICFEIGLCFQLFTFIIMKIVT